MILRGRIQLSKLNLPENPRRRSCQCVDPDVVEVGSRATGFGIAAPGYLIEEPHDAMPDNRHVASLRLCRRCAVALAVAILELEVE